MKSLLTKVSKGVAFGDVSNHAIRNILTEISKQLNGKFTEQEMFDTLEYFDWKCPYTGKDLRQLIESGSGGYATDHVYPQNREWCGLNVKGNLIIVDSKANSKKGNKDVEDFLLHDTKALTEDLSDPVRRERLDAIKKFQKLCGYDPEAVRKTVSPLLEAWYSDIRKEQEERIKTAIDELGSAGIKPKAVASSAVPVKKVSKGTTPLLVFCPSDGELFKAELIRKKQARFVLTYSDGIVKDSIWKVKDFNETSNLRANIQSRPFWRNWKKEGLVRVEVYID